MTTLRYKREIRKQAIDRADSHGDGPTVPVIEFDRVFYLRPTSKDSCRVEPWLGLWFIQFFVEVVAEPTASRRRQSDAQEPLFGDGK